MDSNNHLLIKQKRIKIDIENTKDEIDYLEREKNQLKAEQDSFCAFLLILTILIFMGFGICAEMMIAKMISLAVISIPMLVTIVFPNHAFKVFQKLSPLLSPRKSKILKVKEDNIQSLKQKLAGLEDYAKEIIAKLNKENQTLEEEVKEKDTDYTFDPVFEKNRDTPYIDLRNLKVREVKPKF